MYLNENDNMFNGTRVYLNVLTRQQTSSSSILECFHSNEMQVLNENEIFTTEHLPSYIAQQQKQATMPR